MLETESFTADQIASGELRSWLRLHPDHEYTLVSAETVRRADGDDIFVVIMAPGSSSSEPGPRATARNWKAKSAS